MKYKFDDILKWYIDFLLGKPLTEKELDYFECSFAILSMLLFFFILIGTTG